MSVLRAYTSGITNIYLRTWVPCTLLKRHTPLLLARLFCGGLLPGSMRWQNPTKGIHKRP
jgi:hypothetical protein